MIALEVADLVLIASRTLRLPVGEVLDLLDLEAAERALIQDQGDPASQAAALLSALVRERPLRRGGRPVALAAMLQFLALNGWDVDPDPPGPLATVVADLAAGARDPEDVASWLASRLRPATRAKEKPMRKKKDDPFTSFSDPAKRAVVLAKQEARRLRRPSIGTEHLLLGLLRERKGAAAQALDSLGVRLPDVRRQVEEITGRGQTATKNIPFTPGVRKVLRLSAEQAQDAVSTEHLLLAMLREHEGQDVAFQVLANLGADEARVVERLKRAA